MCIRDRLAPANDNDTSTADAPAPSPVNAAANAEAPDSSEVAAPQAERDLAPEGAEDEGFLESAAFYAIIAACAAAIIACLCCGLFIRRRKKSGADGSSKQAPLVQGGGPGGADRAMHTDGSQFDNNFTNSMHLRNAQAQAPMVRHLPLYMHSADYVLYSSPSLSVLGT